MIYTIEIPVAVEQVLTARAQANGMTITKYLQDIVIHELSPAQVSATVSARPAAPRDAEMDALEELALELAVKYPRAEPLADDVIALSYKEREDTSR